MLKTYIFFADGFEEIEALAVADILRRGSVETVMVSITGNLMVKGSHSMEIKCDNLFEECEFADGDALVLPGGMPGTNGLMSHKGLKEIIMNYYDREKIVSAICAAPSVLGAYGILEGKNAICFPGFEDKLSGATISNDKKVVRDGNIITAKGMGVAIEFGLEILSALEGKEVAVKVASAIQYL